MWGDTNQSLKTIKTVEARPQENQIDHVYGYTGTLLPRFHCLYEDTFLPYPFIGVTDSVKYKTKRQRQVDP